MAAHLAQIYGTELDKVNCAFFNKIGACRHGDKCSRKHIKPLFSQTVALPSIYVNPSHDPQCNMTEEQLQEHFDRFYEDMFTELAVHYGEIEELHVCDNVGDHLDGNVYVRFVDEMTAQKCLTGVNQRFYAGRPIWAELSPVSDFKESCCRQYDHGECTRGGYCNFMHVKMPSRPLRIELFAAQSEMLKMRGIPSQTHPLEQRNKERNREEEREREQRGPREEWRRNERGDRYDRGERRPRHKESRHEERRDQRYEQRHEQRFEQRHDRRYEQRHQQNYPVDSYSNNTLFNASNYPNYPAPPPQNYPSYDQQQQGFQQAQTYQTYQNYPPQQQQQNYTANYPFYSQ